MFMSDAVQLTLAHARNWDYLTHDSISKIEIKNRLRPSADED